MDGKEGYKRQTEKHGKRIGEAWKKRIGEAWKSACRAAIPLWRTMSNIPLSRSGVKLGTSSMEEQFQRMSEKLFWQVFFTSLAAWMMVCISSRLLRHSCTWEDTRPPSSLQCWLWFKKRVAGVLARALHWRDSRYQRQGISVAVLSLLLGACVKGCTICSSTLQQKCKCEWARIMRHEMICAMLWYFKMIYI